MGDIREVPSALRVIPLASDSMGIRSMATFVETEEANILIDPGLGIASKRYGLPPHPLEEWCLKKHRERIEMYASSAGVIVISSFHPDHAILENLSLYEDKILFVKNPNQHVGPDFRKRAFEFIRRIRDLVREIQYADRRSFGIGGISLAFSEPVSYGFTREEGSVLSVCVREGEASFLFTSHVQGWSRRAPVDFIVSQNPGILYLDGPVTYLHGDVSMEDRIDTAIATLRSILDRTATHTLILDHHLLRDLQWESKSAPFRRLLEEKGILIQTAAEARGDEIQILEARRQLLYEEDPVS